MRVRSLTLARYGAFTGRSVAFGPGLTLVVGVNEAGKSTALEALSDLLWGIPARSAQSFRHGHQALCLEGVLGLADGDVAVVRRGTGLTDADGDAVPCDWQGDDDRARWRTSFGLSHTDLREGGRALCQGEGDLAQLVFAARSGRAVRRLLEDIEREADSLFKDHRNSRNVRVRQAGAEYERARAQVADATANAHRVLAVRQRVDQAQRDVELATARRQAAAADVAGLAARLSVVAEAHRLADLTAQAGVLRAAGPYLTADRLQVWADARGQVTALEAAVAETAAELAAARERRALIAVDDAVLADRTVIRRLDRDCRARLADGERAAALYAAADAAARDVAELLASLGGRLESLRIPEDRLAQLDQVANDLSQAGKTVRQHREVLDDAVRRQALADAETVDLDATAVREAYTAIQADGSAVAAQRAALTALADARVRRDDLLAEAGLAAVPVTIPSASAVRSGTELLTARRAEHQELQRQLVTVRGSAATTRAALEGADLGDVPDPEDLRIARQERDAAVADVVAAWLGQRSPGEAPGLPAAVERLTARADGVADRLVTHAEAAARRAELARSLAAAEAEADRIAADVATAADEVAAATRAWEELWPGGPAPQPAEAAEVRLRLVEARAADSAMAAARARIDGLREQVDRQAAGLSAALAGAGWPRPGADLDSLLEAARQVLAAADAAREARARADQSRRNVADARDRHDGAVRALDEVTGQWRALLAAVGVPADLDVAGWARRRDIMARAETRQREADTLRADARQAQERHDAYAAEVAVLAERHGVDDSTALAELLERTDAARVAAGELDDRIAALADAVAQRRRGHADAVARLAELRAEVGTDDLDAAAEHGRRLVELTADIDRLTALVRVAVPDDAVAELATQEPAVLRAGLAQADADLAAADADLRAALTAQGEAAQRERDLVGRTGAAELHARAEERLAVLTESVERYLVVHIQRTVLGAELDAYERKHASPLLAEAGRILEGLTGGRYVALRAANRSLVVVAADDEMRDPAHLSEGTADQVFLALRLAGIASLQQDRLARGLPALPVVLDDVLMTFDDERSAAALRVLAEFAREWQVVVLSHHEHLADLAPPDATVSHLAPPPAMTQARPAADIRARVPQGSAVRRPVDVSARGEVRLWARENGFSVGDRGRIPADVLAAYARAHR